MRTVWKKALAVTLSALMTLGSTGAYAYEEPSPAEIPEGPVARAITPTQPTGDGSEGNPYQISSAGELYWFAGLVNGDTNIIGNDTQQTSGACAVLVGDIVINEAVLNEDGNLNSGTFEEWTPIGKDYINQYTGTFDGREYTISGLYVDINKKDTVYAGLYGCSSGKIQNVKLEDSYIRASTTSPSLPVYASGICGDNVGTITNCASEGNVNANSTSGTAFAGGICGYNGNGKTITNCASEGPVNATTGDKIVYAGGICGRNNFGTITNCVSEGPVNATSASGTAYVGGICGDNPGSITNCVSEGPVNATSTSGSAYAGGISGGNGSSKTIITNCYFLKNGGLNGVGTGGDGTTSKVEAKTGEQFASGEVAWLLNSGQEPHQWAQALGTEAFPRPMMKEEDTQYDVVKVTVNFPAPSSSTPKECYTNIDCVLKEYPVPDSSDPGTAYVYYLSPDSKTPMDTKTQTYNADTTIYAKEKIDVESISLSPAKMDLDVGETQTLTSTISPVDASYQTVTWKSNAPSVATVDQNGTVTAKGVGEAVITATAQDGGKTATCTVTVTQPGGGGGGSSRPTPTPSQQAADKIEDAKDGDTVTVKLPTGQTKLEKEVFEELAGRDVTLEITVSGGVTWTVNGQDIPENAKLSDLDLGVSMNTSTIPVSVVNAITGEVGTIQISLKHDGEFGFTMTLSAPLGKTNAGYWANLYYYNKGIGVLEFQAASRIASDGTASFPFDHASDYAIVIDAKSHEPVELPFTDVPEDYWAYSEIAWAYQNGYMSGTSAVSFNPGGTVSRQQVWMILARMAGADPADMAAAKAWAVESGISDGTNPGGAVTRQQLAVLLYRYAVQNGMAAVTTQELLSSFPDAATVADYAVQALNWAVGRGIIGGTTQGTLNPAGTATRAQLAVMLYRWLA